MSTWNGLRVVVYDHCPADSIYLIPGRVYVQRRATRTQQIQAVARASVVVKMGRVRERGET